MRRHFHKVTAMLLAAVLFATGCQPTQPFYFGSDGTLSRYRGKATEIEYPDSHQHPEAEVTESRAPLTLENADFDRMWPLSLQEAVKHALANGKVLRSLGGRFAPQGNAIAPQVGFAPDQVLSNPLGTPTIFDPAIQEASVGFDGSPIGVEAALSAFDADFTAGTLWSKADRPLNIQETGAAPGTPILQQESTGSFQTELAKTNAYGGRTFVRNEIGYQDANTSNFGTPQAFNSAWTTDIVAGFNQPLMQGAGVQFNRIAGPFNPLLGLGNRQFDGVVLARINTDISLADFEAGVRNMVLDVENTYWELYFAYRNLEANKAALDSALKTWQRVKSLGEAGLPGGAAKDEALAREQYYNFKSQLEVSKSDLFAAESRLRYMMGLSVSDGRMIQPCDEPTPAKLSFNWCTVLGEALDRSVELRKQKWRIKEQELKLIAAKNFLLPRLDLNGLYRWHGFGHDLISTQEGQNQFDNAFGNMLEGDFQEWQLGINMSMKLGFRAELAGVRSQELLICRAKALLAEQELELSHQVADAIRSLDEFHVIGGTNFNRRMAAQQQVKSLQAIFESGVDATGGTHILDLLLEAQRRLADAERSFYRALVDYNRAIAQVHYRKGSLLEYNGVYLTEGPWPAKAYFDALKYARQRDASRYVNYGFTQPRVFSRGPYHQFGGTSVGNDEMGHHEATPRPHGGVTPEPESVNSPEPEPLGEARDTRTINRSTRLAAAKRAVRNEWQPLENGRKPAEPVANVSFQQEEATASDQPAFRVQQAR